MQLKFLPTMLKTQNNSTILQVKKATLNRREEQKGPLVHNPQQKVTQ